MLNHEEIGKHATRIIKNKPFIDKYKWEGINFPLEKDDWKTSEKNNVTFSLHVMYAKKKNMSCLYFKKQFKSWKASYSIIDSKRREIALSCSQKAICIIERNIF